MMAIHVVPLLLLLFAALAVTTVPVSAAASVGGLTARHVSSRRQQQQHDDQRWDRVSISPPSRRRHTSVLHPYISGGAAYRGLATATSPMAFSRRKSRSGSSTVHYRRPTSYDDAILVSSTSRRRKDSSTAATAAADSVDEYELNILGKMIAGVVEIAVTIAYEYCSSFIGGYCLGSVVGIPALLRRPVDETVRMTFWKEVTGRTLRLHGKSFRWAHSWGSISASFGGFRSTIKVLRNGKDDEWSSLFSSMAAGAFFRRDEGPQAMLRGAIMYGGLMLVLSGGIMGPKSKSPFDYEDKIVDF